MKKDWVVIVQCAEDIPISIELEITENFNLVAFARTPDKSMVYSSNSNAHRTGKGFINTSDTDHAAEKIIEHPGTRKIFISSDVDLVSKINRRLTGDKDIDGQEIRLVAVKSALVENPKFSRVASHSSPEKIPELMQLICVG